MKQGRIQASFRTSLSNEDTDRNTLLVKWGRVQTCNTIFIVVLRTPAPPPPFLVPLSQGQEMREISLKHSEANKYPSRASTPGFDPCYPVLDFHTVCCLPWPLPIFGFCNCLPPASTSAWPWTILLSATCSDLHRSLTYSIVCQCPDLCKSLDYAFVCHLP